MKSIFTLLFGLIACVGFCSDVGELKKESSYEIVIDSESSFVAAEAITLSDSPDDTGDHIPITADASFMVITSNDFAMISAKPYRHRHWQTWRNYSKTNNGFQRPIKIPLKILQA